MLHLKKQPFFCLSASLLRSQSSLFLFNVISPKEHLCHPPKQYRLNMYDVMVSDLWLWFQYLSKNIP